IVIPPAIFFYYSTLFDSRFKTLQQNHISYLFQNYALLENQTVQYNFELAKKFNSNISNDHIYNLLTDPE
ncbi:hypothetical protein ABXM58_12775, partial [Enterococcus faecium]